MSPAPSFPNLSIMTAGSMAGSRSGPLRAEAFAVVLATLRGLFEFILIDTPAISSYSDALGVGQAADGLALIVAEQDTRKKERAPRSEANWGNRMFGCWVRVLNKRTFPIPQKNLRQALAEQDLQKRFLREIASPSHPRFEPSRDTKPRL